MDSTLFTWAPAWVQKTAIKYEDRNQPSWRNKLKAVVSAANTGARKFGTTMKRGVRSKFSKQSEFAPRNDQDDDHDEWADLEANFDDAAYPKSILGSPQSFRNPEDSARHLKFQILGKNPEESNKRPMQEFRPQQTYEPDASVSDIEELSKAFNKDRRTRVYQHYRDAVTTKQHPYWGPISSTQES